MRCNTPVIAISALLLTSALASGDSLTVELTGVSGANDGQYYVLPYQLTIDGTPVDAICYDALDEVSMDQVWPADELSLAVAASQGLFSDVPDALSSYETVAYLASYWFTGQITILADQIALQHAIWNVFDPGAFTVSSSFVESLLGPDGLAPEAALAAFNQYNDFSFLEAIPEDDGYLAQSFVLYTPEGGGGQSPSVPEPRSTILLGLGLLLIGILKIRPRRPPRAESGSGRRDPRFAP